MNRRNDSGFIQIIISLLIFLTFGITIYSCLDILNLIDVPEEYSVSKFLEQHVKLDYSENDGITDESLIQNTMKKVKVEIESDTESFSTATSPDLNKNTVVATQGQLIGNSSEFLYYNQLDDYSKVIYLELEKNLDNMKSGTYNVNFGTTFDELLHQDGGEDILNNDFQLAINALNFDNPELFYIDISKVYLLTTISTKLWTTTYTVEIGASQGQSYLNERFASREDVSKAILNIENEKNKIISTLRGDKESQIKGVHDYLVANLEYDSTISKDNIYNIYGALINKCTVCEGYARAFKYIMDEINIPCLIACGTGINSAGETESHAWNYVMLDGEWYAIDVTWDDPIIVGNGYVSSSINYKYYLKGSDDFFKNHFEDGEIVGDVNFKYPTLCQTNY